MLVRRHQVPWECEDSAVAIWLGALISFPSSLNGPVKIAQKLLWRQKLTYMFKGKRKRDSHFLRTDLLRVRNLVELYPPRSGGGRRMWTTVVIGIWRAARSGEQEKKEKWTGEKENIHIFLFWLWLNVILGFPGGAVVKNLPTNAEDARDMGSIPGSGKSLRGGNSYPLQYSCLENPMDRGDCQATVNRVTKSQTWLNLAHMHAMLFYVVE